MVRLDDEDIIEEDIIEEDSSSGYVEQSYFGNVFQLNIGKLGTFYFTFNESTQWRDRYFVGILEQAGRDYFIIKSPDDERRYLLPFVYFLWAEFDEEINY